MVSNDTRNSPGSLNVVTATITFCIVILSAQSFQPTNTFKSIVKSNVTPLFVTSTSDGIITQDKGAALLTDDALSRQQAKAEKHALDNHDNYAMNALFVNVDEQPSPVPCTVVSDHPLPSDLPPGCLLRIGPNGGSRDFGFLDGDGMIHAITIPEQTSASKLQPPPPMYSATYVETNGRKLEEEARLQGNDYKFKGTLGSAPYGWPMLGGLIQNGIEFQTLTCQKDTCNTAMAISGKRILALMEQSRPSEIEVHKNGKITTIGSMLTLDGAIEDAPITGGAFGAHGRTDPETGERIQVSYNSNSKPFVKVDTFDENWQLSSSIGVDIPAPVMVHDCAITKNYAIICDFPLTIRPARFLQNKFPVEYEQNHSARIGLVLRNGKSQSGGVEEDGITRWFNVEPGVVLHLANAYETDDGKVFIHGLKSVPKSDACYILNYSSSYLHEWVIDTKSNEVIVDRCLNPNEIVEFPAVEDNFISKESDSCYSMKATSIGSPLEQFKTPEVGILLDGIVKFSLKENIEKGISAGDVIGRFMLPNGWHFITEPTIVKKVGGGGHYALVIATEVPEKGRDVDHVKLALDGKSMRSQMMVLDGEDISRGPVSIVDLPSHLNYGLHSVYVPWDCMK